SGEEHEPFSDDEPGQGASGRDEPPHTGLADSPMAGPSGGRVTASDLIARLLAERQQDRPEEQEPGERHRARPAGVVVKGAETHWLWCPRDGSRWLHGAATRR